MKIWTNKSNESINLELSTPTYASHSENLYLCTINMQRYHPNIQYKQYGMQKGHRSSPMSTVSFRIRIYKYWSANPDPYQNVTGPQH